MAQQSGEQKPNTTPSTYIHVDTPVMLYKCTHVSTLNCHTHAQLCWDKTEPAYSLLQVRSGNTHPLGLVVNSSTSVMPKFVPHTHTYLGVQQELVCASQPWVVQPVVPQTSASRSGLVKLASVRLPFPLRQNCHKHSVHDHRLTPLMHCPVHIQGHVCIALLRVQFM